MWNVFVTKMKVIPINLNVGEQRSFIIFKCKLLHSVADVILPLTTCISNLETI